MIYLGNDDRHFIFKSSCIFFNFTDIGQDPLVVYSLLLSGGRVI